MSWRDWSSDVCSSHLLREQRDAWVKMQKETSDKNEDKPAKTGAVWHVVTRLPLVGESIEEWVEEGEKRSEERRVGKECRTRRPPCENKTDWTWGERGT